RLGRASGRVHVIHSIGRHLPSALGVLFVAGMAAAQSRCPSAPIAPQGQGSGSLPLVSSGLLWTHSSGAEGWTPRVVAIGNRGTEVCSAFGPYTDYTRVFSSFDSDPPTPILQVQAPVATWHQGVAASEQSDVQAQIYDVIAPSNSALRQVYVRCTSAT